MIIMIHIYAIQSLIFKLHTAFLVSFGDAFGFIWKIFDSPVEGGSSERNTFDDDKIGYNIECSDFVPHIVPTSTK